jgi:hypothetical protein
MWKKVILASLLLLWEQGKGYQNPFQDSTFVEEFSLMSSMVKNE